MNMPVAVPVIEDGALEGRKCVELCVCALAYLEAVAGGHRDKVIAVDRPRRTRQCAVWPLGPVVGILCHSVLWNNIRGDKLEAVELGGSLKCGARVLGMGFKRRLDGDVAHTHAAAYKGTQAVGTQACQCRCAKMPDSKTFPCHHRFQDGG